MASPSAPPATNECSVRLRELLNGELTEAKKRAQAIARTLPDCSISQ